MMYLCVYVTAQSWPWLLDEWVPGQPRNLAVTDLIWKERDSYKPHGDTTRKIDAILRNDSAAKGKPLHYISGYGQRRASPV